MRAQFSTEKQFLAHLTRLMYSIYERAPNVNISGRQADCPISPLQTHFDSIVKATKDIIKPNAVGCVRKSYIRSVIDQTNRNYRYELRQHTARLQRNVRRRLATDDESQASTSKESGDNDEPRRLEADPCSTQVHVNSSESSSDASQDHGGARAKCSEPTNVCTTTNERDNESEAEDE